MKELKLWGVFLPFLGALGLFEGATATSFDRNEIETLGATASLLRLGAWMLKKKPIRDFARALLDSMEKNEQDGTP